MYTKIFNGTELTALVRNSDSASIGIDEGNRDYQAYLKWLSVDKDAEKKIKKVNMSGSQVVNVIEPEIKEEI